MNSDDNEDDDDDDDNKDDEDDDDDDDDDDNGGNGIAVGKIKNQQRAGSDNSQAQAMMRIEF